MSEFRPLCEQKDKPLPESPLFNMQLGNDFNTEQIGKQRRKIINFLRLNPEQDPELDPEQVDQLLQRVGCPIPESVIEDIELVLAELLSNAERPEVGRHATAIYVWADALRVGIGVGDDSDTVAGRDERPQTAILVPDLGAVALDAYDAGFSLEGLQASGQGGNLLSMLASRVSYSMVSEAEAASKHEPRTHKFVRADFDVPFNPVQGQAA